jgi:hypothetical protein
MVIRKERNTKRIFHLGKIASLIPTIYRQLECYRATKRKEQIYESTPRLE